MRGWASPPTDRAAAAALQGRLIGVPESELEAPAAGEYYWRDLEGLRVYDAAGHCLGCVAQLLETGANDVLVVEAEVGEQVLIPFHRRYVVEVDLGAGRIEVDWQQESD